MNYVYLQNKYHLYVKSFINDIKSSVNIHIVQYLKLLFHYFPLMNCYTLYIQYLHMIIY